MKRVFLGLALVGTLIAVFFAPRPDEANVVAPAKLHAEGTRAASASSVPGRRAAAGNWDLQIHPRKSGQELGNVFAGQTWTPLPVPEKPGIAEDATPPAPQAPPLPFHFLGRVVDNGKTAYFLQYNDRNLVMRPGDSLDQAYTLDGISQGTLTFTYLPLNQKQTLVVGEVN